MAGKKNTSENPIRARIEASSVPVWCRFDELIDVTALVENPRNPNKHPDKQVALLAKIIRHQGWRQPITVSNRSGFIVKGHGRLQAARVLNVELVPVEYQDYANEAAEMADLMADNRIAELAEPDAGMISDLLADDVLFDGFDMDLTGFDCDALEEIMPQEPKEGLTDEDEVPEVPEEPTSKLGQIWRLGDHRLMCGDSTDKEQVEKLMDGQKADMCVTDPPYNVNYEGKTKDALKIENDKMEDSDFRSFLRGAFEAMFSALKDGGAYYIWHADLEGYNFRGAIFDCGEVVRQCLIWVKQTIVMGRQDYHWKHEPCLYGWKSGAGHKWTTDRKQSTVLEFDRPFKSDIHPTMKPIDLIEYQIGNNSKAGHSVLDLFLGSGSTLIACERTGRKCYGMELDPKYCDVIIKRWEDFTGKKAELING